MMVQLQSHSCDYSTMKAINRLRMIEYILKCMHDTSASIEAPVEIADSFGSFDFHLIMH